MHCGALSPTAQGEKHKQLMVGRWWSDGGEGERQMDGEVD